ncbi:MAG: hypothetical protein KIS62_17360 [Ramlibacter sp.]|nr:hypothetical protein [Ramlibacter sp.]
MAMRKVLGLAPAVLQGESAERAAFALKLPLPEVRERLQQTLRDCASPDARRLHYRLQAAGSVKEFWMMRSDLYECIARDHSQAEAARRINALLPCFDGWLPSRLLVRI